MKTSSAAENPRSPNVSSAWGWLTANLALPGVGSYASGYRVSGVIQMVFGLAGLALTFIFGIKFISWYVSNWTALTQSDDPVESLVSTWEKVRWALAGIAMYGFATLWAISNSLSVLRRAKQEAKTPPRLE